MWRAGGGRPQVGASRPATAAGLVPGLNVMENALKYLSRAWTIFFFLD